MAAQARGAHDATRVLRFNFLERLVHWVVAISFIVAALTGLGLYLPGLFWLTVPFGGGTMARVVHPWAGVVFAVSLLVMVVLWAHQMWLDRLDWLWLRRVKAYVTHGGDVVPAGRFNAGQKLLFWAVLVLGILEFATGLYMWNPDRYGGTSWLLIGYPVHSLAAALYVALIILHIYMATAMLPGTLESMTHGRVLRAWARAHHPRWYEEIEAREAAARGGAAAPAPAAVDLGAAPRQGR